MTFRSNEREQGTGIIQGKRMERKMKKNKSRRNKWKWRRKRT